MKMNFTIDTQNHEQMLAYELVANTNSSFFLTGRAGTGKTTFLHNVQKSIDKEFIVLAPTGVAAILAGGDTIHSFFGLPMDVCCPGTCGKMNDKKIQTLLHADTIIIDEVSMVRCDIIDTIDFTMRKVLRNNAPFGGKQMIFVGDMFQLPPVVKYGPDKTMLTDIYHTEEFFFYKSRAVSRMRLVKIEFRKVYRQGDEEFLRILEHVRLNNVTPEDIMRLNERVKVADENDGAVITLTSVNKVADSINQMRLEGINGEEYEYEGTIEGRFEERRFPVDQILRLKVGAQVMFTRNDAQKPRRWANGTLGVVTKLNKDEIHVKLNNGETHKVPCCTWESFSYDYDVEEKKMKKERTGSYTQFPLRLAWAITIHKSQGMTFDRLAIDLSRGMFVPGQLYVALSRVRSLEGLFLSRSVAPQYANTSKEILLYANGFNDIQQINNEIESGKAVYEALQIHNYDEAAKQYLSLVNKFACQGDIKEAMQQAKRFLDIVICDEHLYGTVVNVPFQMRDSNHWAPRFLYGLLSLYSGHFQEALSYMNKVLSLHHCAEALFVKIMALDKMRRTDEAFENISILQESFENSEADAKVFFQKASLNFRINGGGFDSIAKVITAKPKYDKAICLLREMMRQKGLILDKLSGMNCELVDLFNSEASDETFAQQLQLSHSKSPKAVKYLVRRIGLQNFEEKLS